MIHLQDIVNGVARLLRIIKVWRKTDQVKKYNRRYVQCRS